MEKIVVSREIKTNKDIELEIEDIRNVFLKGRDIHRNTNELLGIWIDKQGLKIVSILNQSAISIDCNRNVSVSTRVDIECFLKNHNNVVEISKEEFRKELNRIMSLLGDEEELKNGLMAKESE